MNVKRISLIGVALIIAGLIGLLAYAYWTQLRGAGPALTPPPANIGEIIEQTPPQEQSNGTDFPLKLPQGFSIETYANNVPDARVMIYGDSGRMFVSSPDTGKIFALEPAPLGEKARVTTLIDNLNKPHGMAFYCPTESNDCRLYVAEEDKLSLFQKARDGKYTFSKKLVDFPKGGNHTTRTLMIMPYPNETKMLISIGSSCNVCHEENPLRATIQIYDLEANTMSEYAKGLRNSVFMSIHPVTGKIWATEMGRDLLGDYTPPDEINVIEKGKNYGWPICYGKNIHDDSFDKNTYIRNPCAEPFEEPSYIDIPAHSAPLGLAFFPEEGWPQEYWHNVLVAYHGSWNRTVPTGYKIVRYKLDDQGNVLGEEDFITGWLQGEKALGRPVDILIQPGGTIFVSDDKAGVVYRIFYRTPSTELPLENNLIRLREPKYGALITSPLLLTGEARGNWYFEASFPIALEDGNGRKIAETYAQAKGEWMTPDFVPFESTLTFTQPQTETGTLVLKKDNPSGLPEHDASLRIPVRFK